MEFHVPTIDSPEASQKLEATILTSEPNAKVDIDVESQKVTIESAASAETFKQIIVASGHKID